MPHDRPQQLSWHPATRSGQRRLMSFDAPSLTLELELLTHAVQGQIVPPGVATVTLETAEGVVAQIESDALGYFVLPARPAVPFRLTCTTQRSRLVTSWLTD